jgi:Uma2 family endonuclease
MGSEERANMDKTSNEPRPHRWTREQFYQMLDLGWFQDQRVELIDGEVLDMPSQKNYHGAAVTLTMDALRLAFGSGFWVRNQLSLDLSPYSVPDPDLAVVPGSPQGVSAAAPNPTTALLVVEVSDSSLPYDYSARSLRAFPWSGLRRTQRAATEASRTYFTSRPHRGITH